MNASPTLCWEPVIFVKLVIYAKLFTLIPLMLFLQYQLFTLFLLLLTSPGYRLNHHKHCFLFQNGLLHILHNCFFPWSTRNKLTTMMDTVGLCTKPLIGKSGVRGKKHGWLAKVDTFYPLTHNTHNTQNKWTNHLYLLHQEICMIICLSSFVLSVFQFTVGHWDLL